MTHADSIIININYLDIHRLIASILDISNVFKNKNVPIFEIVCVSPSPYYLDWFENSCSSVPLSQYHGPFCLQCMNIIQGTKHQDVNGIGSLMQWLQFLNIIKANFIMIST